MPAQTWQYLTQNGILDGPTLTALGAAGWELVTVVPPLLQTIPVIVGVNIGISPPAEVPVGYDLQSQLYIFKKPL
jgi:hypothetical protein